MLLLPMCLLSAPITCSLQHWSSILHLWRSLIWPHLDVPSSNQSRHYKGPSQALREPGFEPGSSTKDVVRAWRLSMGAISSSVLQTKRCCECAMAPSHVCSLVHDHLENVTLHALHGIEAGPMYPISRSFIYTGQLDWSAIAL